jgi:hypothetical protein
MFRLNPVGALILELLGKGRPETEIAKEVSRRYSISEENATADLREFLKSLRDCNLVQTQEAKQA